VGVGLPEGSILAQEIVELLNSRRLPQGEQAAANWLMNSLQALASKIVYMGPLPKFHAAHNRYVASELGWARGKNNLINGYKNWLRVAHLSKEVFSSSTDYTRGREVATKLLGSLASSSEEQQEASDTSKTS
jgi:hypothetical protein